MFIDVDFAVSKFELFICLTLLRIQNLGFRFPVDKTDHMDGFIVLLVKVEWMTNVNVYAKDDPRAVGTAMEY